MTMGASKTFTACTASYRLLKHARRATHSFVDRRNLGNQTGNEILRLSSAWNRAAVSRNLWRAEARPRRARQRLSHCHFHNPARYFCAHGKELAEEEEDASAFERADDELKLVAYNPKIPIQTFDLIVTDDLRTARSTAHGGRYWNISTASSSGSPRHLPGCLAFSIRTSSPNTLTERSVVDTAPVGYEIIRIRTPHARIRPARVESSAHPVMDRHTRAQRYETLADDLIYTPRELDRSVVAPNNESHRAGVKVIATR